LQNRPSFQTAQLVQALSLGGLLLCQVPSLAQGNGGLSVSAASEKGSSQPALVLQNSLRLEEKISEIERKQSPLFVSGQRLLGRPDLDLVIDGGALLRKQGLTVRRSELNTTSLKTP
jgi:LPS-assembly protein